MAVEYSDNIDSSELGEECLLSAARKGDLTTIQKLLHDKEGIINLNINMKGQRKSNNGWTALHLASYFGHTAIAELLVKNGADVNIVNSTGDSPLHKATYTGRKDIVFLLLSNNASVCIKNGEGQTAREICNNKDIARQLLGAERTDLRKRSDLLLQAAKEGDTHVIEELLKTDLPLDINCRDSLGNTSLHWAANCGKREVAILLLQNGIDPHLTNRRGKLAIDLAVNESMKQIVGVPPMRQLQKTATRFEGPLLRKSRFLGWKEMWTVLEKGTMSFFMSRADASTGTRRKGYKYLDGTQILVEDNDDSFVLKFSNNARQRFSVPSVAYPQFDLLKWWNAIEEHIEFSTYFLKQGKVDSDIEDDNDLIPLGTMKDKFQTAQAHQQLLEKQINSIKLMCENLPDLGVFTNSTNSGGFRSYCYESPLSGLTIELDKLAELSRKAASSLSHCLTVFSQQEEIRLLQLKQQQEQIRVLQDAIHALAQEHHDLERSFVSPNRSPLHSPPGVDTDCDEFFDAFEGDYSPADSLSHNDFQTHSTDIATENETTFFASFSSDSISHCDHIRNPQSSKWGRAVLPVPMFSRNDFSVWSILKQCIGKELSKITMPIIFNEPISFLQRLSENIEYCDLLVQANNTQDPVRRLEYVTAFAVAAISSNLERLGKPFNPLLGETFEFTREDLGVRAVYEQVSHHPPVSAFHADSQHFVLSAAIHPKLKLWARSVEIKPEGTYCLKLLKHNEVYTWTGVNCCVHNIIVGKLWMEQCGTMEINCHTNGLSASLNFKPAGWYGKDLNCVEGFVYDRTRTKLRFLYGEWCSHLRSADIQYYEDYQNAEKLNKSPNKTDGNHTPANLKNSKMYSSLNNLEEPSSNGQPTNSLENIPSDLIWEGDLRPDYASEYYNFTSFAMALNEFKDDMATKLPPTDSRQRPDIRKLEVGDLDNAAAEKHRLEEKQREARKKRKKENTEWIPLWFVCQPHEYAKENTWVYKGNYWDRNFVECPDIF